MTARHTASDPLSRWLTRHAVVMLVAAAVTLFAPAGAWVALAAAASFADLIGRRWQRLAKPYGNANQLTTLRLVLLLTAAAFIDELPTLWLWLLLAANVVADVVDGYVARRTNQVTQLGAVLDREVDAVFVLVAYLYFYVAEGLPAWVLIPGLLPYLYRVSTIARRDRPAPDQRERLAGFLAGTNFVVLLIAVGAPPELQLHVIVLSMTLVGVSFAVSFVRLFSNEYSAS